MAFLQRKCDAALPPSRIQLVPSSDVKWPTSKAVRHLRDDLIAAGFTPAGTYDVQQMPNTRYMVFVHEQSAVLGMIIGTAGKTWLDIMSVLADGRSFTVSSCEDLGLPQKPGNEVRRVPAANALTMREQVLRERGNAIPLTTSSDMVAVLLEQQYAKHANWLIERGGYTREEICRVILRGKNPDHPDVFMVRESIVRNALTEWWKQQRDVPAIHPKHFQDCVFIIHDDLMLDSLDYLFSDATGDWDSEIKKVPGQRTPREAFAMLNRMRGEPLVRIFEKATPLEADFYCHRALLEPQPEDAEEFSVRA